jgi:biopolymer transport protein ExbD/biopolymer transport protein TolR
VTLNEINITPLLDLAFVLLIIFVITTPLLEQSINLKLPVGGAARESADPKNVVSAEVGIDGVYYLRGRRLGSIEALETELRAEQARNPDLIVRIRADREGKFRYPVEIIDAARRNGITRFDIATEAPRR